MLRRDGEGEAKLDFRDSDYRVVKPGAYVVCAVSGKQIPLESLSYWSAERQEAYAGPAEVAQRLDQERAAPK